MPMSLLLLFPVFVSLLSLSRLRPWCPVSQLLPPFGVGLIWTSVQAYDPSMEPVQLDIINCAVLYESPLTGSKVLMNVEEAI